MSRLSAIRSLEDGRWLSSNRMVAALLLFAAVAVYANSFPGSFIQDDLHIVQNNPLVQQLDPVRIFSSDYWHGIEYSGLYRPLTILSLALNRLLTGPAPWGFHLVNVLLQAGVVLLIWVTLRRWDVPRGAAFLAALLFAVHPIHTEVVNQAVGRSELLVGVFLLLALHAARSERRWAQVGVLCFYLLALLSKEHAVVLLAIIPLFDSFWHVQPSWRRRWPLYAGMLLVTVAWLAIRAFGVQHHGPLAAYSSTAVPLAYVPWDERVLSALQYQWLYLAKLFVPHRLQAVYSLADLPPLIHSVLSFRALLAIFASAGLLAFVLRSWRRRQTWALFALCYIAAFAPTSNILFPMGVTVAERLAYLPSVWFCAALGVAVHGALKRGPRAPTVAIAAVYLCFLAGSTLLRNPSFASEIRLWSAEVRANPEDFLGWQSMAEVLSASSRHTEAEQAYRYLLHLQPDFQGGLRSYANFLLKRGRFSEALETGLRALRLAEAEGNLVGMGYDLTSMAQVYIELQHYDQALAALLRPEAVMTENRDFYYVMLGHAYAGAGNYGQAVEAYRRAKVFDGKTPLHYGRSLFMVGLLEEAQPLLEQAARLGGAADAWHMLGSIHASQGRPSQALRAYEQAVRLDPDNAQYLQSLQRFGDGALSRETR